MKDFPAIKVAILFVLGILSEKFISIPFLYIFIPIILLVISFYPPLKEKFYRRYSIVITSFTAVLIFVIGNLLIQTNSRDTNNFLNKIYRVKNTTVIGEISKIDLKREKELVFYTATDSIISDEFLVKDKVKLLCKFRDDVESISKLYNTLRPGNDIKIIGTYYKGREKRNPGEFDYNKYLNSKGIIAILLIDTISNIQVLSDEINPIKNIIHHARKALDSQIRKYHAPETASLLRGLLLADRREIDYETKNQFINAGVIHVLAVSGLHVGYIVLIFFLIFGRFNLFLRSALTIIGLLCFMLITGVPPSVFRATLMAIVLIFAFFTEQKY
jgi:competence protein ComEC